MSKDVSGVPERQLVRHECRFVINSDKVSENAMNDVPSLLNKVKTIN